MKYAYVMSEKNREVTFFDFTDKTTTNFIEYSKDEFDTGSIYSWDESMVTPGVGFDYASIEWLTSDFCGNDVIISSDLLLKDICKMLGSTEYSCWNSSFDVCSKMLKAYSKLTETETISLEDLIKEMKQ